MQHQYDSSFLNYADRSSQHSARTISSLLRKTLKIGSVLDIGCAKGTWLGIWNEGGVADIQGIDGAYAIGDLVIPPEKFLPKDLAKPIALQRTFDLVQSLEVAEHIPVPSAEQFVDNVVAHSAGVVLFSAAPPGQGGEFHVNEQPYDYWREKFQKRGFFAFDYVRPLIRDDRQVSFWYRFNTLLYVREDRIAQLPEAVRATRVADGVRIPDVSPAWFRARKFLVRLLPEAVRQKLAGLKAAAWRNRSSAG
jgi:hypothetical protein